MADPSGFLKAGRQLPVRRPVDIRIRDWREVYEPFDPAALRVQAARCMDCGIPFCHNGCPLGNLIPEWNELVRRDDWQEAIERLHATNNFPEFTGKLCPAPCESACVLAINDDPVTIKQVEHDIIERAFAEGWVQPQPPASRTGHRVAVVGSGPAGLAAAQQLTRAGHDVTVYERDDRLGGLMRYGIPEFKMEKSALDRRLAQMHAEGTTFVTGCSVGTDLPADELRASYDAVLLTGGALAARDVPIPGRGLEGIHLAMDYLTMANRFCEGDLPEPPVSAAGRSVVIVGGGDTAADCLGTVHRQGAASVRQLDIHPRPPASRHESTPWPTWPLLYRSTAAHEEGGDREFAITTRRFEADATGRVRALVAAELLDVTPDGRSVRDGRTGPDFEIPTDLVLLAVGFSGPERPLVEQFGVELDERGTVRCGSDWQTTAPGVYVAGDAHRGASLIVWAVAEGRSAAAAIDCALMGESSLPAPVTPASR